jgi:ornithine cyclodeaminase/alanine dehydrogenase-like protein (mu-crystallin family)
LAAPSRFFPDQREGVLAQSSEFLAAPEQNLITEDHLLYELGEVIVKPALGRTSNVDVTIYKSLGSVVQYPAAAS